LSAQKIQVLISRSSPSWRSPIICRLFVTNLAHSTWNLIFLFRTPLCFKDIARIRCQSCCSGVFLTSKSVLICVNFQCLSGVFLMLSTFIWVTRLILKLIEPTLCWKCWIRWLEWSTRPSMCINAQPKLLEWNTFLGASRNQIVDLLFRHLFSMACLFMYAESLGTKVRTLIRTPIYRSIFFENHNCQHD
jgi:hypothetical protein